MKIDISLILYAFVVSIFVTLVTCSKLDVVSDDVGYQKPSPDSLMVSQGQSAVRDHNVNISEPATAPSLQTCTSLNNFTVPFSVGLFIDHGVVSAANVDSVIAVVNNYNTRVRVPFFVAPDQYFPVKDAVQQVIGGSFILEFDNSDIPNNRAELFVGIVSPSNVYNGQGLNRPGIELEVYSGGQPTLKIKSFFEGLHLVPTEDMNITQIEEAVEFIPHESLSFDVSNATPADVDHIGQFYLDNCITGDYFSARTIGVDSSVYHIMKDTLQWTMVRI